MVLNMSVIGCVEEKLFRRGLCDSQLDYLLADFEMGLLGLVVLQGSFGSTSKSESRSNS